MIERHPKRFIKSLSGAPADNAPNIPKHSASPVTTVNWFGLNHLVDNFKIETQATPIDAPIISLPILAACMDDAEEKMKAPRLDNSAPAVSNFLGPQ